MGEDAAANVDGDGRALSVGVREGPLALQGVLGELNAAGIRLHDAGMRRPTLDDVFLKLTGHTTGDGTEVDEEQAAEVAS